jgi:protein gp37
MSDLFHEDIPYEFILSAFEVMGRAHWHTFQVLTKRSERLSALAKDLPWAPNIWQGVSVEDQARTKRIDDLRNVPATIRFLSIEPLLGPIAGLDLDGIDWVIVGGESGLGFRQVQPDWVRQIREHCSTAGVAFFFKQWGGFTSKSKGRLLDGELWNELPCTNTELKKAVQAS